MLYNILLRWNTLQHSHQHSMQGKNKWPLDILQEYDLLTFVLEHYYYFRYSQMLFTAKDTCNSWKQKGKVVSLSFSTAKQKLAQDFKRSRRWFEIFFIIPYCHRYKCPHGSGKSDFWLSSFPRLWLNCHVLLRKRGIKAGFIICTLKMALSLAVFSFFVFLGFFVYFLQ